MTERGKTLARWRARAAGRYRGLAIMMWLPLMCACRSHDWRGRTGGTEAEGGGGEAKVPVAAAAELSVFIPLRTPQLATYPCVEQCHRERKPDPTPRPLKEFHSLKHIEHGDTTFWCNFCHNDDNLDLLHLLDGRTATFDEAYRLCGECHGDKRRDWQAGVHGLQTGQWNGQRTRRSCTACHDPHAPRRPKFQALPPPTLRRGTP